MDVGDVEDLFKKIFEGKEEGYMALYDQTHVQILEWLQACKKEFHNLLDF